MKTIVKYRADNGKEFYTENEAIAEDILVIECDVCNKLMPSAIDPSTDFANGGGYVQQTAEDIKAFKDQFRRLLKHYFPKYSAGYDGDPVDFMGRLLSEMDSVLYRLWLRLNCVDSELREWGQPYYAGKGAGQGKMLAWPNVGRVGMEFKT